MSSTAEKPRRKLNTLFSSFYLISGLVLFLVWAWYEFYLAHIGLLSTLSLAASYGMNKMKRWTVPLISVVSTSGLTLSLVTIYFIFQAGFNFNFSTALAVISVVLYAALSFASLIYTVKKRSLFG